MEAIAQALKPDDGHTTGPISAAHRGSITITCTGGKLPGHGVVPPLARRPSKIERLLYIDVIKKTKKNEPKYFKTLCRIDREAFGAHEDSGTIMKTFWKSSVNKIAVARKSDTQAIVGYAAFFQQDASKEYTNQYRRAHGNKAKVPSGCYLMRIGVSAQSQRQGIGRKLMEYLFDNYPAHVSLDVSTDNVKAVNFYKRVGLEIENLYITEKESIEFACFKTPPDFVYKPPVYITDPPQGESAAAAAASDPYFQEEVKQESDGKEQMSVADGVSAAAHTQVVINVKQKSDLKKLE